MRGFGSRSAPLRPYDGRVGHADEVLGAILGGRGDATVRFEDLCLVLRRLGFAERVRGSHRIFRHPSVPGLVNLQPRGGYAKPYQVRQVRRILLEHPFLWRS